MKFNLLVATAVGLLCTSTAQASDWVKESFSDCTVMYLYDSSTGKFLSHSQSGETYLAAASDSTGADAFYLD